MRLVFFVLSFAAFVSCAVDKLTLPVTTCRRNESDYTTCLKLAIEEAWPRLVKGLPEFEFPPLDPYVVKYLRSQFNRGILSIDANLTNIFVTGMANVHIFSANTYFLHDNFHLEIDLKFPMLLTRVNCDVVGSMDQFKLYGKGELNIISDANVSWRYKGRVVNDTWIVKHPRVLLSVNKLKFSLKNFFNGDQGLTNLVELFMNEHWPMLYRLASKEILESLTDMVRTAFNLLFSKVSFSNTFPE